MLSVPDEDVRSATFDGVAQRLFLLRGEQLFAIPFGAAALARGIRTRVKYCLSKEEREVFFSEWSILAAWWAGRRTSEIRR